MQQIYANSTASNTIPPSQQQVVTMPRIENVSCVFPATEHMGGLYIGNYFGAINVEILKEYGIRAVLTTSVETPVSYPPQQIPFHKKVDAHDKENFSIMDYMEECLEFIERHRSTTNVFVHCYAGMSRSATVVVAYLMKTHLWPYDSALAFLRWKRAIVNPNQGFAMQLRDYQQRLGILQKMVGQQLLSEAASKQRLVGSTVLPTNNNQMTNSNVYGEMQMNASMPLPSINGYGQYTQNPNIQQRPLLYQQQQKKNQMEVYNNYNNSGQPQRVQNIEGAKFGPDSIPRPPSQQSNRAPSAKTLPLYQRSPNKVNNQPTPPMNPRSQRTLHEQTPIPNFLQKRISAKQKLQKDDISQKMSKQSYKDSRKLEDVQLRASKVAIRPRDLPGYRVS